MINYTQIQKISSQEGMPEEIIEKDYLIELILYYLSKDRYLKEQLVFRGGTALKKIYFRDYRFSEDLDFLIQYAEELKKIENKLNNLLEKINNDYPFQLAIGENSEREKDRIQIFIVYNIIEEIRAVKELKIDIIKDDFIPTSQDKKILFTYLNFQENLLIRTYDLESTVSDKISRILDVINEPRDIYDLWYLLKLNIDTKNIKKEFKNKHGYDIIIPNLLREIFKKEYKQLWNIRLEKQIRNLPDYNSVVSELENLIKVKLNIKNSDGNLSEVKNESNYKCL